MRYNIFLRIFLHLIKLFFITININIFSNNKNIEIRQCCKCGSCKEQNNKIINNNLVKQLEAIKGDKIIVKDKMTGNILEEAITENVTTMEKYLREKFKDKDIDITHTTIYWPKEEYFKEDSISNASENEAIKKISNCPIVDNKNKDKNENNKTVEFETIKETSKKSIEILKNIHNEHINSNHSYLKTNNNELSFHYIRYIIQGNIVDNLKNLLFGQDEKGKCWQIEVLTNNGNIREKNEDIYPQFNDNHILKEINFSRITEKTCMNAIHKVKNTFSFTEDTEDSFICTVKSSATSENNWKKNFLGSFINSTTGAIPDVYTDIVYSAKYDKNINTTFFITLATFHYKGKEWELITNQIKEQAKNTFTSILGQEFSEKLKTIGNEKLKNDSK